jgi:hypothetical protein
MADLVEVAFVGDEVQAAMIQALLEQHEIPSLQEQAAPEGVKLGSFFVGLGGGQRRVMVHAHRAAEACAVLDEVQSSDEIPPGTG